MAFLPRFATGLAACAFAAVTAGLAPAADYSYRTASDGDTILRMSGVITPLDGAVFLEEVNRRQPRIVEVEGPGGDMLSAARVGVIIHERGMWTHAVGDCASACAFVWMAGRRMLADEGVALRSHLPGDHAGGDAAAPSHKSMAIFGWYLGKLDTNVDMMAAFIDAATQSGRGDNQPFDLLAFARYWNAPVEIVAPGLSAVAD